MLEEFFGVTVTSLYRVSVECNEFGWPTVEKLAVRKDVASDVLVGTKLRSGHFVGVTRLWLMLYDAIGSSGRVRLPEDVNIKHWGGRTAEIVALFLNRGAAEQCFGFSEVSRLDPRWAKETMETLVTIGTEHTLFIVSQDGRMSFPGFPPET